MLRLIEPSSGAVRFRGENVLDFSSRRLREARRDMQIVFQDPYSSLNPRMRARQIVEEPLIIHRLGSRAGRQERVAELFRLVGLNPVHLDRYPHQFSGGQRQRIGMARALALNPSPAGAVEAHLSLHRPRSAAGGAHLQPCRGDVSGQDRRDRTDLVALRFAPAPVHEGAAVGYSSPGSRRAEAANRTGPCVSRSPRRAQRDRRRPLGGNLVNCQGSTRNMKGET